MIYAFAGTDTHKRQKAVSLLLGKFGDLPISRFDDTSKDLVEFHSLVGGDDLFAQKRLVVIDQVFETDCGDRVFQSLSKVRESENIVVIIEAVFDKEVLKNLGSESEKVEVFDLPKGKEERFNIFEITDAFGARDKKSTWVLFQKALRRDISAEEVLNILIWQTKNLLSAKGENDMKKTGLSPFVYGKSSKYSRNFEEHELQDISRGLMTLYHESHLGLELAPNLELFLLRRL